MPEGTWEALRLSALVGVAATVLVLPPAAFAAWKLRDARFRGRSLVEAVLLLPLVLPPVVTGFALLALVGRGGLLGPALDAVGVRVAFTWKAAVLASAVTAFPLAYRACRTAFEGVDPRLVALARTLGAGPFDAFVSVALPLARGGVAAAAVLAFARAAGEFGATIVVAGNVEGETRTLPLLVWTETQSGGVEGAWGIAGLSVLLALAAMVAGEALSRRRAP